MADRHTNLKGFIMITLTQIIKTQTEMKVKSFNTDLFLGDRENLDQFDKGAYSYIDIVTTDHKHDRGEHDKLVETVVAVGHESDFYLVTATHSSYNNEAQVSFTEQPLTLKGFNYFNKGSEKDCTDIYNEYLLTKGYELTIEDIKTLGELNTEYNVTTLRFKDEAESMHYLTVNSKEQLSSVTVKHSAREVKSKATFQSAFN